MVLGLVSLPTTIALPLQPTPGDLQGGSDKVTRGGSNQSYVFAGVSIDLYLDILRSASRMFERDPGGCGQFPWLPGGKELLMNCNASPSMHSHTGFRKFAGNSAHRGSPCSIGRLP